MSYADGLLSTGERILRRSRQHPFVFIWGARYTILAVAIAGGLIWIGGRLDPDGISGSFREILGWITAALFFGGIVVFAWTILRFRNQEYVLTDRRVIGVEGVLNRRATDSSLEKINDAVLSQSVAGRMLDFGDLTVLTASESGIERMQMIRSPIAFKKAMLDAKHAHEVDMERSGWATGPPIREGGMTEAGVAAGVPETPGPPVSSAPGVRADPEQVARTLTVLAELRDSGTITADEYQAKKTDLLARL